MEAFCGSCYVSLYSKMHANLRKALCWLENC